MKFRKPDDDPKFKPKDGFLGLVALTLLYLTCIWPSDASGDDKKVSEGYYGSERIRVTEKAVRGKSGETRTTGYIGARRIRMTTKTTKHGTITTGYVGNERVRVKEDKQ